MKTIRTLTLLCLFSISAWAQDGPYQTTYKSASPTSYTGVLGDPSNSKLQVIMGYVNKSWICTYDGYGTQREDFFGDPNEQFFHGFQVGALYTPAFSWGLGLRTGLTFEFYISHSKWIRDWCTSFNEIDLYIPLHAMYRYTGGKDFGFEIFAGASFQLAMDGRYYKWVGTTWAYSWSSYYWYRPRNVYATERQDYGNGWPQRVNWQADIGINFRYKMMGLGFTYSFGLNDHGIENSFDGGQTFVTATKSRQDKMQATLSFYF